MVSSTPLVGTIRRNGIGPRQALTNAGPVPGAGKSLTSCAPARCARSISVGVDVPGIMATPSDRAASITVSSVTGETRYRAPALTADLASSAVSTVPAPTTTLSRPENCSISSKAWGVVSVNSTTLKPPRMAASIAGAAASATGVRRIADARCSFRNDTNSSGVMGKDNVQLSTFNFQRLSISRPSSLKVERLALKVES